MSDRDYDNVPDSVIDDFVDGFSNGRRRRYTRSNSADYNDDSYYEDYHNETYYDRLNDDPSDY